MKKLLCAVLSVLMLLGIWAPASFADVMEDAPPFRVVFSIEGNTIGQGLYVEPTIYTLDEINEILKTRGFGPFTEDNLTASMASFAFFLDKHIEFDENLKFDSSSFYLEALKNLDKGTVTVPEIISQNGGPTTEQAVKTGNADEWLGQFDYSAMSSWMIIVNNFLPDKGAGDWLLKKEVENGKGENYHNTYNIRWNFTLFGYGADLGFGWGGDGYYTLPTRIRSTRPMPSLLTKKPKRRLFPLWKN